MKIISQYKVTQSILNKYELHAKKRFGQNFIIDPSVVEKIARESGASDRTTVIEIGPGLGALTQQLSMIAKEVISIEIDSDMVNILNQELNLDNVQIVHQDFLEYDLSELSDKEDLVVCANVPYYITTPILFKLIESGLDFRQITLMVQKELGQRLVAEVGSKEYNALSIMMATLFDQKTIMNVDKRCFYPSPKVDSVVVGLTLKGKYQDFVGYFSFVKKAFTQRRKTLVNNFKEEFDISPFLTDLGHSVMIRPQQLTPQQFRELYEAVYEKESLRKD